LTKPIGQFDIRDHSQQVCGSSPPGSESTRLLERVSTVSDHDPVNVLLRQEFVDAMGKFEPVVARQAGTSDLKQLFATDICSNP
jgi:hypothetical protein